MNSITKFIEDHVTPIGTKMANNKILNVISTGLTMTLPLIILGAIFTLLSSLQIGPYQQFLTSTGLGTLFSLIGKFTTEMLSIYVAFTTAYTYLHNTENMERGAISAGLISIMAFFIMNPLTTIKINDNLVQVISFDFLGSKGLFTALLTGILVGSIYVFVTKHNWTIKMPESVPEFVANSFNALIPAFLIAFVFIAINGLFNNFAQASFGEWFYSILAAPLSALSGNLATHLLLTLLASVFWFFGLHGGQITGPFLMILFMQAGMQNQAAYAAGQPMQNILTVGLGGLLTLGGIGCTIGLAINLCLFSKSSQYKSLGKLAIIPSICGINEPLMFGMPMILNPIMVIPFFIAPQVINILTYVVMKLGLVGLPRLAMFTPGTPILLDAMLMNGFSGVVWQILMIAFSVAIYYPFFKVADSKLYAAEIEIDSSVRNEYRS